jgi:hypothetical protein
MALRPLILLPATAAILIGLLTGCVPTATAEPSPPPSDAPSTPSAEPSDATTPTSVPIDVDCDTLVSPDAMYAFNPNFGLLDDWQPEDGSAAADAVALDGVACQWLNQTSGDTIDLSVASLDADALETLKNEAVEQSTMVPTYGEEAYFEVADGVGTAIVFDRSYWLVVSSDYFLEPGDATEIVEAALSALP